MDGAGTTYEFPSSCPNLFFCAIPQGTNGYVSGLPRGVTKYIQLYYADIGNAEAGVAFTKKPITFIHGETRGFGNDLRGKIEVLWKNQGVYEQDGPQYLVGMNIQVPDAYGRMVTIAQSSWHDSAPVVPGFGVPTCLVDESKGITGVVFPECGQPGTIPPGRVRLEFNGTVYSVVNVYVPGTLY